MEIEAGTLSFGVGVERGGDAIATQPPLGGLTAGAADAFIVFWLSHNGAETDNTV